MAHGILVFFQNFFSAVLVTVANSIFQEVLTDRVLSVPGINPGKAVEAGGSAEAVRALVAPGPARDALLGAYSDAFGHVFYLLVGVSGAGLILAFGMGWVDLRKKDGTKKGEA